MYVSLRNIHIIIYMTDNLKLSTVSVSDFPKSITVSGFPLIQMGWNEVYKRTNNISDGKPTYRLDSYILYGFLVGIIGVTISSIDGVWCFTRDGDQFPIYNKTEKSMFPFGVWNNGIMVTPNY